MKKILFYVLLACVVVSLVFSILLTRDEIKKCKQSISMSEYYGEKYSTSSNLYNDCIENRNICIRNIIFVAFIEVVNLVSAALILYHLLKHPARMTYEEYKEKAEIRKAARQEKKRAALQEKQKSIQDELDRMK